MSEHVACPALQLLDVYKRQLTARFGHSHLDRPPLGDVAETLTLLAAANPAIHFSYDHSTPSGTYRFDTQEIIQVLEGVPLGHPEILPAIQNLIRENLKELHADQSMSIRQS